jgi:hypothetical protein
MSRIVWERKWRDWHRRRGRGRFVGRLPDGLEDLRPHNGANTLFTFRPV